MSSSPPRKRARATAPADSSSRAGSTIESADVSLHSSSDTPKEKLTPLSLCTAGTASSVAAAAAAPESSQTKSSPADTSSNAAAVSDALPFPRGVCVKVAHLRPRCDNLEEWLADPRHVLLTRHGRVFVGTGASKKVFHYPSSFWANPFRLKDYTLAQSLRKYEEHLDSLLRDESTKREFVLLREAEEVGCFCDPGSRCHRDVVLQKLRELCKS